MPIKSLSMFLCWVSYASVSVAQPEYWTLLWRKRDTHSHCHRQTSRRNLGQIWHNILETKLWCSIFFYYNFFKGFAVNIKDKEIWLTLLCVLTCCSQAVMPTTPFLHNNGSVGERMAKTALQIRGGKCGWDVTCDSVPVCLCSSLDSADNVTRDKNTCQSFPEFLLQCTQSFITIALKCDLLGISFPLE